MTRHIQNKNGDVGNGAHIDEVVQVVTRENACNALQEKLTNQYEDPNADASYDRGWTEIEEA